MLWAAVSTKFGNSVMFGTYNYCTYYYYYYIIYLLHQKCKNSLNCEVEVNMVFANFATKVKVLFLVEMLWLIKIKIV